MALGMMRQISANIQNAAFLTIMADETTNVSKKQQPVIWIRWVNDGFCDTRRFHWNASFGENKCRLSSSNYTKECPTENKFKHLGLGCPWAVL